MNILIVDDEIVSRLKMQKIMSAEHDVQTAEHGEEALRIVREGPVDMILLDIVMPGLDGYEVCRRLKNDPQTSSIPVIFLTGMDQTEDVTRGFELGCADFITKPVSPPILKARVRAHLAVYHHGRILEAKVRERTEDLSLSRLEVLTRLCRAADFRDNETGLHVQRVSMYCRLMARAAGMKEDFVERIGLASPLHDLGKIGIPDQILLKPGKLTPEEFAVVKTHCVIGADILRDGKWDVIVMAQRIARTHHEKWNGNGYPEGLRGEAIPIDGRTTAIADVFDAISTKRPYKEAWPLDRCVELINSESGKHFDPRLVDAFNVVLPEIKLYAAELADEQPPVDHGQGCVLRG